MLRETAKKRLIDFGFRMWNEKGLLLIPEHRLKKVPKDFMLTSIQGDKMRADKIDTETRAGLLAWGVLPEEYEVAVRWFQ